MKPLRLSLLSAAVVCAVAPAWADPTQPVDYIQFDPFDSPWRGGVAASAILSIECLTRSEVSHAVPGVFGLGCAEVDCS